MQLRQSVHEGEVLPPWYYGCGYRDYPHRTAYFYPIPMNYVVRVGWWLRWRWNRQRSKATTWIPYDRISHEIETERRTAYHRGLADGYRRVDRDAERHKGHVEGYNSAIRKMEQMIDDA